MQFSPLTRFSATQTFSCRPERENLSSGVVAAGKVVWGKLRGKGVLRQPQPAPSSDTATIPPEPRSVPVRPAEAPSEPARYLTLGGERVLNVDQAYEAWLAAPFLQREDVSRHYEGLRAGAAGTLYSLEPWLGAIRLQVATDQHVSVFAYIEPADYPGLALLKRGVPMEITGTVESLSDYGVILKDIRLRFDFPSE